MPAAPPPVSRPQTLLLFGSQCREEDDVADGGGVGEQHDEAVDADAETAGWWQAVLERTDVVLVDDRHGLGVARRRTTGLLLEAGPLVVGVDELGEGVRELTAG